MARLDWIAPGGRIIVHRECRQCSIMLHSVAAFHCNQHGATGHELPGPQARSPLIAKRVHAQYHSDSVRKPTHATSPLLPRSPVSSHAGTSVHLPFDQPVLRTRRKGTPPLHQMCTRAQTILKATHFHSPPCANATPGGVAYAGGLVGVRRGASGRTVSDGRGPVIAPGRKFRRRYCRRSLRSGCRRNKTAHKTKMAHRRSACWLH
jgi:hypothetical protein